MDLKLKDWSLTEGRIPGENTIVNPSISDMVAALEAIHPKIKSPYVILEAPPVEDAHPNYLQALAVEDGYRCEIRLYGENHELFSHYFLLHPDENGSCGDLEEGRPNYISGYDPDLVTVTAVFIAFSTDSTVLPEIPGGQWLDITSDFDA